MYQSEVSIYNTCIADSYATDQQNSVTEARIRSYCSGSNSQSCIASYDACQTAAPLNGFGQPNGASCTYTCNTGYYLDVSGLCDPEKTPTSIPTPAATVTTTVAPVATPTPVVVPAAPTVVTQTVVTQSVTPPTLVTKPKSIFAAITQIVAAKPAVSISATTSASTTVTIATPVVVHSTVKPTSFWGEIGDLLSKLNPLNWF